MERLESSLFDWLTWRQGTPSEVFNLACRECDLTSKQGRWMIHEYAVGWCSGESVPCRPKTNTVAVMFFKGEKIFWFHLRKREFRKVFNEMSDM